MMTAPESLTKAARRVRSALDWRVNRAVDSARSTLDAFEGALDAARLKRKHPRLVPAPAKREQLHQLYRIYVAEVSSPVWTVSWETVNYLRHLCDACQPHRVADLGSGFSSYVFRDYAASVPHEVSVVSVDDSEQWLGRTRDFLAAHDHDGGELRGWHDFAHDPGPPFDVIFHDLADRELRRSSMSAAVSALASRGLIVFDDAHRLADRRAARQSSRKAGMATYSLFRWTNDAYGRFAMLGAS